MQVMPLVIPLTYYFLLPTTAVFMFSGRTAAYDEDTPSSDSVTVLRYTPLSGEEEGSTVPSAKMSTSLAFMDKMRLVRPLLLKYMLPLCECSPD